MKPMELIQIAALGKNRQLGLKGDMPWGHTMKKDLQFFKTQTKGHPMVMGRKTWQSLPGMLPGRKHIVISRAGIELPEQAEHYFSVEEFLKAYQDRDETVFVIGGGSIYKALLPFSQKLMLTRFDSDFEADVFFPELREEDYTITAMDDPYDENGIHCQHFLYEKK